MAQKKEKRSEALSLDTGKLVRGYEVRRLPIGGYLRALERLREAPEQLMEACFPGRDAAAVLGALAGADKGALVQVALRVLEVAPAFAVGLIAQVCGIPEERLLNDPGIGLDGLMEIIEAWAEVNGTANFLRRLQAMCGANLQAATAFLRPNGGCSG